MDFKIIPFNEISEALEQGKITMTEQKYCNTAFHKEDEIKKVLPDIQHKPPDAKQPWILLEPWLDLIARSRRLDLADIHVIRLPGSFLAVLPYAFALGASEGRINVSDAEDLDATFPKSTTRGADISKLLEQGRYFPRLNTCSLKDAILGGVGPISSPKELWTRIVHSKRAKSGIESIRAHNPSSPVELFLFPWDDHMHTALEYRVFCPSGGAKVSAISQYKWHSRWFHADKSFDEQRKVAERVLKGVAEIHNQLMEHPAMSESLKASGFTFDVVEDTGSDGAVRLIELNDFGGATGCGSCCFQWIKDARVLYGLRPDVEFRVTC